MSARAQRLRLLEGRFAIARLPAGAPLPGWLPLEGPGPGRGSLVCVLRTESELSIVCVEELVPATVRAERGLVALEVQGPLDFSQVGILASLLEPLQSAAVPVLALSSFDTDHLLVRADRIERALTALVGAGHQVTSRPAVPRPAPARP